LSHFIFFEENKMGQISLKVHFIDFEDLK